MKKRIFTLMMAFLAIAGNAVWGQSSYDAEIEIKGITTSKWTDEDNKDVDSYSVNKGADNNNVVTIKKDGSFLIKDSGDDRNDKSNVQIKFAEDVTEVSITLNGIKTNAYLDNDLTASIDQNPDVKVYSSRCAMEIPSGVTVTLNWIGDNKLWSGGDCAGINVEPGATLILAGPTGSGSLEAGSFNNSNNTHTYGAGIGGDKANPNFGDIIIRSGTINAYSQVQSEATNSNVYGAGIGGGYNGTTGSTSGSILITGGTINAYCDNRSNGQEVGAGIGGGNNGTCDNIIILGGTVTAISNATNDIGANGTVREHPEIIIGRETEETTTTVTGSKDKTNFLNASGSSYDAGNGGLVRLPEGLQMCLIAGQSDPTNLGAYKVCYKHADEITSSSVLSIPMAYGPNTSYSIEETAETAEGENSDITYQLVTDLWLDSSNKWIEENSVQKTGNDSNLSSITAIVYSNAWVLKEHTVSYTTTAGLSSSFNIYYPAINGLFEIADKDEEGYTTLEDAGLAQTNYSVSKDVDGDCLLIGRDEVYKLGLSFTPKGKSNVLEGLVNINITDKPTDLKNLNITFTSNNSVYDGTNQWLSRKITIGIKNGTTTLPITTFDISFSTDYSAENAESATWTAQPIDAGDYYLKVSVKDGYEQSYTGEQILQTPAKIAQRPMNISISFNKQSIEEDEELTWDDVTVTPQALEDNSGIVAKDAEDFKKAVTGKINYTLNEEGTIATVEIFDVEVSDQGEFLVSNYNLTINRKPYTKEMEVDLDDPEVPVTSSSTGGSFNDHRYQLFLANKDYLKTDKKTVEYYEDLKLELFSLHKKKYTDVGGSFTVWYEKDGVANPGGYRLFWSKSGEHGDYQEVKFDEVSGYYQIRNVQSDVYVKIYDADGFPVANEAITAQDFRAYAQANKIIVITPEPTDVQIISMAGAVVAADKVTGQREFANLAEGVYIVRMGETIVKLQVRN